MDALSYLAYPHDFFGLVNLRFGISFVRMWEWRKIFEEMLRVSKDGGIIRITETSIVHQSTSPALQQFQQKCLCALQHAGYLPEFTPYGLTRNIAALMSQHGVHQIQTKPHCIPFPAGTLECTAYVDDVIHAMRTLKPFIQRWGCLGENYDEMCKVAQEEMYDPHFSATWELLTAWGEKSW
jgi:hypothetical protein